MPVLTSLQASKTHRVLLYGPPKSGKTEWAGKLAEKKKLLYIGIENGHDTFFKLPVEWQSRINVVNIPDSRTNPIGVETVLKIFAGAEVKVCNLHGKVACPLCAKDRPTEVERICLNELASDPDTVVILDSLTQFFNSAMSNITRNKPEDYKPDWDDWARQGVIGDKLLSQIQVARYNCIVISHEIPVEMNDGKEKLVPVGGTRNASRNVAKYFDDVIYCQVVNKEHRLGSSTKFAMNILTGSRSGVTLEGSKEPTLLDIFK